MTRPLGIILAGGLSRRMGGGDKALLTLAGDPLLAHVIRRIRPQVADPALNANGDPDRFKAFGLPVIADTISGFAGPLAGVLAGLDWAATKGTSHIVTVAADTPFFPQDLVTGLENAARDQAKPIALALTKGGPRGVSRHPTFGLWPVALRDDLRAALKGGTRKVVAFTDQIGCADALFASDGFDPFFNVNTPDDMDTATKILRDHPSLADPAMAQGQV